MLLYVWQKARTCDWWKNAAGLCLLETKKIRSKLQVKPSALVGDCSRSPKETHTNGLANMQVALDLRRINILKESRERLTRRTRHPNLCNAGNLGVNINANLSLKQSTSAVLFEIQIIWRV